MNTYYTEFFEKGQQKINFNLYQIGLPSDDPVFTLKKVLEDLNYASLLEKYSHQGRKGYNPIMLFAVLVYANMRGVKAIDRIVELCRRDIAFIWLTGGLKPGRDVFYEFIKYRLTGEVLSGLHYQFMRRLQKEGLVSLKALFIDGTKIEANANRYTFVWRGSINYHLANLLDQIKTLYASYNALLKSGGYGDKYGFCEEAMLVIEGIERVKTVIEKNRNRKLHGEKKVPNKAIITIENCSPLELLKLQTNLTTIAKGEDILFTVSKGQRKSELQKLYEAIESCGERLMKYKNHFEIMGADRNSYSKTDFEATFMRMKDDHMRNGQLKPAYNVQIAVENYFIIHSYISNDRTDYDTLIPVLDRHRKAFLCYPEEVTADSGYSSEKNLDFLSENHISSYIKLQAHEKMKTKAWHDDIGKHYNMTVMMQGDIRCYRCHDGRLLSHIRTETGMTKGYERKFEVYACDDCSGCRFKVDCLYRYDPIKDKDKNKVMKVNQKWEALKAQSDENIRSEKGIINRQIRSIQTEGHFGDIKENNNFRRFNYRSREKVEKEFQLYIFGRNLNKYHRFIHREIEQFVGKKKQNAA